LLSFFPTPYPDELLYSVFARYHVRSGNISMKATMNELFKTITMTAIVDIPCGINTLADNLPISFSYTAEKLILGNTMFPYYTAFLSADKSETVKNAMKGNIGGGIHTKLGIMASSIKVPGCLKFCPECNQKDYKKYGEFYWHRLHQIPGVLVCPTHRIPLQYSTVQPYRLNKHEYVAADQYNCRNISNKTKYNDKIIEKALLLARDTEWLIKNYKTVKKTNDIKTGCKNKYVSILKEIGVASPNGRVYQKEFVDKFVQYYGEDFLETVQSNIDLNSDSNWLARIVRKHRNSFHPIRHLLLIRFLAGSPKDFFQKKYCYSPFGNGPWPCLNIAAEHYRDFVIDKVNISHCCDTKLPVGTFECSCGFIYSRRGPDNSEDDLYKIGRIKEFGAVWKEKLKQLVEIEKLSLREIARELNVDPKTVKKYTELLKLKTSRGTNSLKELDKINENYSSISESEETTHYYRNKWRHLIKNFPNKTKTELRQKEPGIYIWLYRHDKKWFDENSPCFNINSQSDNRVNWEERDEEILIQVKKVTSEILNSTGKPERITVNNLGKRTGFLPLLQKHIEKLPKTKAFLNSIIETVEDYQIRRVKWAVIEIFSQDEVLKEWKIIRKAGLRPGYSKRIQSAIITEIEKYYTNTTAKLKDYLR